MARVKTKKKGKSGGAAKRSAPKARRSKQLCLGQKNGIESVSMLVGQLQSLCNRTKCISIDASQVTSIDTAALQVLIAYTNALYAKSRTVDWKSPSAAFHEAAEILDLKSALRLDDDPAIDDDDLCPVF